MLKRIHVNQHKIRRRQADPISVKTYKGNTVGSTVEIVVSDEVVARVVYRPDKPLPCGARVWIETTAQVRIS
jgi:hypothetical protein